MSYPRSGKAVGALRLHYNENTAGCSPAVIAALSGMSREDAAFYPDYGPLTARCAREFGVGDDWLVTVESRRGRVEFAAEVTPGVRTDTLFAPFHWGGRHAANLLTNPALDPTSRMPEFKLAAVRIAGVRVRATEAGA